MYRPSVYGSMTLEQFRGIFQSETDVPIPLLERRLRNLHEAAAVLNEVRSPLKHHELPNHHKVVADILKA